MNAKLKVLAAIAAVQLIVPTVFAQNPIYQVTGRIVQLNSGMIVVRSGSQRLVILQNKDTKVWGPFRVGDIVTIDYRMVATNIQPVGPPRRR